MSSEETWFYEEGREVQNGFKWELLWLCIELLVHFLENRLLAGHGGSRL